MSAHEESAATHEAMEASHGETVRILTDILDHPEASNHNKRLAREALNRLPATDKLDDETRVWAQKTLRIARLRDKMSVIRARHEERLAETHAILATQQSRRIRIPSFGTFIAVIATVSLFLWFASIDRNDATATQRTASQNTQMVAAPPAEATPTAAPPTTLPSKAGDKVESTSRSVSFEACLATIRSFAGQFAVAPENVVETNILRIVRFPTSDGYVLVTCSRLDNNMTVTTHTW